MNIDGHGTMREVLYVEDEPVNAILMTTLFEARPDLRLHLARTGGEAWGILKTLRPSLLLLDLILPDCHGLDLLRRLRGLQHCQDVPAIAVTADVLFDPRGSPFGEMWSKPLHVKTVLARLAVLLPPRRVAELPAQKPSPQYVG